MLQIIACSKSHLPSLSKSKVRPPSFVQPPLFLLLLPASNQCGSSIACPPPLGSGKKDGRNSVISDLERPVWFYVESTKVEGGTCRESRGPYTIEDLRIKWMEQTIDASTL